LAVIQPGKEVETVARQVPMQGKVSNTLKTQRKEEESSQRRGITLAQRAGEAARKATAKRNVSEGIT
jgi:hypothetical protein